MPTPPPLPPVPGQTRWYYADDNHQPQGPVSLDELKRFAAGGAITPETYVIEENGTEWKQFSAIAERPEAPPPLPRAKQPATGAAKPLTDKASAGGCCGIIAGILLSCTGVGAIIGVPLIIWILIRMGKAQRAGTRTPISGKKLYDKAPGKRPPDSLSALVVIASSLIIICALVIAVQHNTPTASAPANKVANVSNPSPEPSPNLLAERRAEIREQLGKALENVFGNDLLAIELMPYDKNGSLFAVIVRFNATDGARAKNTSQWIENKIAEAYRAIYTSDSNAIQTLVDGVAIDAHCSNALLQRPMFGANDDLTIYQADLSRETAKTIDWAHASNLNIAKAWDTVLSYRQFLNLGTVE